VAGAGSGYTVRPATYTSEIVPHHKRAAELLPTSAITRSTSRQRLIRQILYPHSYRFPRLLWPDGAIRERPHSHNTLLPTRRHGLTYR
jgi:hypothetical protein